MSNESVIGNISINISETDVTYDSAFSIPEVVFWLDVVRYMILNRVMSNEESVDE